jgi:hypothetical protein
VNCCLFFGTFWHLYNNRVRNTIDNLWNSAIWAIRNWIPFGLGDQALRIVFGAVDFATAKAVDPVLSPVHKFVWNVHGVVWHEVRGVLKQVPGGLGRDLLTAIGNAQWCFDCSDPFAGGFKTNFVGCLPAEGGAAGTRK